MARKRLDHPSAMAQAVGKAFGEAVLEAAARAELAGVPVVGLKRGQPAMDPHKPNQRTVRRDASTGAFEAAPRKAGVRTIKRSKV